MAFNETLTIHPPRFLVVESYEVFRLGLYAGAKVRVTQCNYYLGGALPVLAYSDADLDGLYEVLEVSTPAAPLLGRVLSTADSVQLATVTSEAALDAERTQLTLSTGLSAAQVAAALHPVERMVGIGTTAYTPAPNGHSWTIILAAENPQALGKLLEVLGAASVNYGLALVNQLGLSSSVSAADVQAAVQALVGQGINIDGMLAQQGEALEQLRRAGNLTYASVMGAPEV